MCKHILINDFRMTDIDTIKEFVRMTYDNDGYGCIIRTNDGKMESIKAIDSGLFYIELMHRLQFSDVKTLVIHHRTSTNKQGLDYAHPFEYQGHWLTHNGVVSVPGKHKTKTYNDSEKLLHHLVKTNYDTKAIQGYFSCFILTEKKTMVLVDDCAPMFSDGRIYSSHDLGKDFVSIQKMKVMIDLEGNIVQYNKIELTKSNYGSNLKGKSLGKQEYNGYTTISDAEWEEYKGILSDNVEDFFSFLTKKEEKELYCFKNRYDLKIYIDQLSGQFGLDLKENEMQEIMSMF